MKRKPSWLKSRIIKPVMPDEEALATALSLVGKELKRDIYRKWTDKERFLAMEWAVCQHLIASDNIIYKPPKQPVWVKKLRSI